MDTLPLELLHDVVQFVSKRELHRLAHVSKRLRSVAIAEERFFIFCHIVDDSDFEPDYDAIEYAATHQIPLALKIDCGYLARSNVRDHVIDLIKRAFSMVVILGILCPPSSWDILLPAIRQPASSLRYFCLRSEPEETENVLDIDELPVNLFSGRAPLLRSLVLSLDKTIPNPTVFTNVEHITLALCSWPYILITREFPSLRRLSLKFYDTSYIGKKTCQIDCRGARSLRRLDLSGFNHTRVTHHIWNSLCVQDIPLITVFACAYSLPDGDNHPLVRDLVGPLAMRAEFYDDAIFVRASRVEKQRIIRAGVFAPILFRVFITALSARVVDLETDFPYLLELLSLSLVSLPTLERLLIRGAGKDRIAWPDDVAILRCDQLVNVICLDGIASIVPTFVDKLSRALGQHLRPMRERARLEIVGNVTAQPAAFTGSFSAIVFNNVSPQRPMGHLRDSEFIELAVRTTLAYGS